MTENFEKVIDRKGTSCVKYDMMERDFGSSDLLPMWVADMDYPTPDFVLEDLKKRLEHPFLGYTFGDAAYWEAVRQWLGGRYAINALNRELHYIPGIVAGIAFCIQSLTREGDAIVVMTPVYPPFVHLPVHGKRELRTSRLQETDGRFYIDFPDLDEKLNGARLLILSNPHNPGGRVWSEDELRKIAALCAKHGVPVISDEIHADLTYSGHRHISFSTVSEEARQYSLTFVAPSKTFNIAGLSSSVVYVPNPQWRERLFSYIDGYELANGNVFAYVGAESAFRKGEAWLEELLCHIRDNADFAIKEFHRCLPAVKIMKPEASFLLWMNFSALGLTHAEVRDRLIHRAHVALNDGVEFGGKDFEKCFRMNIGCPHAILEEGIQRICSVF